ncbi:MAG: hypothetical protein RLY97_1570 [Pseudomonadota bacterium]|jgi:phosphoribosyl 1,2-cyclic phosphate phosphodiesterase
MKLIMLGSGTSTGVPRIGAPGGLDWGDCDPNEPKNRRSRSSIVVENQAGARLLIDTSTDLRAQLIDNNIDTLDAVFWTHDHADHCHGIDDLRCFRYGRAGPVPGFAADDTVRRLRQRFGYIFAGQHGYPTIVAIETLDRLRMHSGFGIGWCQMPHGPMDSTGFKFDCDGKTISYAVDFSTITDEMVALFRGTDILVVDCLRYDPHPTHAHVAMAMELIERTGARQAVLTHLDKTLDYQELSAKLPGHIMVGFDGLILDA